MPDFLALDALPAEHPRTVVVKSSAASSSGALGAAFANGQPLLDAVDSSSGLAQLARLEGDGYVASVVPIGDGAQPPLPPATRGMGALSALAAQESTDSARVATLVTFTPQVDVDSVLTSLVADPQVQYATRVPARYVAVPALQSLDVLERRVATLEEQVRPSAAPAAPLWNLAKIGLLDVEAAGIDDAQTVRVAVLDTGVDPDHPALRDVVDTYSHGNASTGLTTAQDVVGHGTHVGGTISSTLNASLGTRGVCNARLKVWKIFDDRPDFMPRANIYWYLVDPVLYRTALAEAVGQVDVLNLSIGGTQPPDPQEAALFQALIDNGVTVVAAMGNDRSNGSPTSYPAAIPGVIAVGATTTTDTVASFSNFGSHITLAAPGTGIWSTLPTYAGQVGYRATQIQGRPATGAAFPRETNYAAMDGTSMAAPQVAAAVALLLANSPARRTPQEVHDLLMVTAAKVPAMNRARWTPDFGAGRLDLRRLMFAARRL